MLPCGNATHKVQVVQTHRPPLAGGDAGAEQRAGRRRGPALWPAPYPGGGSDLHLSATPLTNLARLYSEQGDPEAGLVAAQDAINLDPSNSMAWNNAGLALFHQQRFAEAQQAFEMAAHLQPENALFWNNLAAVLMEQDQLQEAERVLLEESLGRSPNQPLAHLNLGAVYLQTDRPELAIQHLQEALRLLPPDQTAQAEALLTQAEKLVRQSQ
jgi:tetratricopeptide (TPR) repeat protein